MLFLLSHSHASLSFPVTKPIPDATLEVMAGAGHVMLLDQPEEAASRIRASLAAGDRRGAA